MVRVRPRADAEEDVRRRQVELPEEDVGHPGVVVLPRMDEDRVGFRVGGAQRAQHRSRLHEVRARAHDEADPVLGMRQGCR